MYSQNSLFFQHQSIHICTPFIPFFSHFTITHLSQQQHSGLSAAIRLKQLEAETGKEISVCVVEKGAEVGAHILSGNVFEPRALDELLPDWKDMPEDERIPLTTPAGNDKFIMMTSESAGMAVPNVFLPHWMHNDGNYISSLSQVVRWLGAYAENLGVEIYPGFSASEVVYHEDGGK